MLFNIFVLLYINFILTPILLGISRKIFNLT